MISSVDWNDQKAFLAVLEGGSLSAAARALGLSQPTVRTRIEALEHTIGKVLFTRSAQGLLPTDAARALGDAARAMAHASESFLRTASAAPDKISGVVRIAVGELVGAEVLPPMLARLRERHPELSVELMLSNSSANLAEQEADVAVRMYVPTQDTLIQRKVGEVVLQFFAHRDYLARRGVPTSLADLIHHDLIGPDRVQLYLHLVEVMLPSELLKRIVVRTDNHMAQIAAARAGLGIAAVQYPLGVADPVLLPVLPDFVLRKVPFYILAHRDLRHVPRISATFDHLVDEFTQYARG